MTEVQHEVERKYEPADGGREAEPAEATLPETTRIPGVADAVDEGVAGLDAVYYDTVDQRLAADRITLRRRTGGADDGWHLKVPAGDGARDEIRAPLGVPPQSAKHPEPPEELTALVRAHTRGEPLVPVVRIRSGRRLVRLLDRHGGTVAELSVDRVDAVRTETDAAGHEAHWTEAELELADGTDPAFLDEAEPYLRRAGWRPSAAPSKLARALAETATGGPPTAADEAGSARRRTPRAQPAGPLPEIPRAAEPVLAYLRAQRDALLTQDTAVRRGLPDSVHRMRVATRRLRSTLRSYGTVLDRARTAPVAAELKWLAGELGVERDREVLAERLFAGFDALPHELHALGGQAARDRLTDWDVARRCEARRRVAEALDSRRHLALLDALDALLAGPPLRPDAAGEPRKVLRKAVRRAGRKLERRLGTALAEPPGPARDAALHEARKAAKRLRYTAEAAAPVLGRRARRARARAKGIQKLLGDHHDSVVARRTLRELGAGPGNGFLFGVLHAREAQRAAQDETALVDTGT